MDMLIYTALGLLATALTLLYTTRADLRASRQTQVNGDHGLFSIRFKNTGPGSATVRRMVLTAYGVSTADTSDSEFVHRMAQPIDMQGNPGVEFNVWEPGDSIAAGEELLILEVKVPRAGNDLERTFRSLQRNVAVEVDYRSTLGVRYHRSSPAAP